MLEIIISLICFVLFINLHIYMIRKMLDKDIKIYTKRNIFLLIVLVIISLISYTTKYSVQAVIIRFIANIIVYKLIFDESVYKITILLALVMLINTLGDIINTSIVLNFYTLDEIRSSPIAMLLSNCIALVCTYLIFNIKFVLNKLKLVAKNLNDNNIVSSIIICVSIFILAICTLANLGDIFTLNMSYFINVLIVIVFVIVLLIFFVDNNKYQNLVNQYDSLFKYIQTFESSMDKINLSNHEFKNELIMLKSYIKDDQKEKSLNIINDIIAENKKQDSAILTSLKNLPKGGIKGLLYYKIIVAMDNKLKVSLDVSSTIKGKLNNLDIEQSKLICNLIGIYLDNAIEASRESGKKLIGIEIYTLEDKVEFVFSNTFKDQEIDLDKVDKNGYTTKGKNHGRGRYLAKRLIEKNDWVSADTKIMNNMYIQKVIIYKNKLTTKDKKSVKKDNKKNTIGNK